MVGRRIEVWRMKLVVAVVGCVGRGGREEGLNEG